MTPLQNDPPLDICLESTIIKASQDRMAVTEESRLLEADREAGAKTATPTRTKPAEVPSRAARVNTW
jgi:hypothetical protein